MPIVTYTGKQPIPVYHELWLHGERRELSEKQARQLDSLYPGLFSWDRPKAARRNKAPAKVEQTLQELAKPAPETSDSEAPA